MKLSSLRIDATKIEAGAWVRDIPGLPGVAFKVRGRQNAASRSFHAKAIEAVPRLERIKGIAPETAEKIDLDDLIENILLDWSGIEGDDGKPLPYSVAEARRVLADPDFTVLRGSVAYAASVVAEVGTASLEADLGN